MNRNILFLIAFVVFLTSNAQPTYNEPQEDTTPDASAWSAVKDGVHLSWCSRDVPYKRHEVPSLLTTKDTIIYAWKGERVGMEALAYSKNASAPLSIICTTKKTPLSTEFGWLRYVLTDAFSTCGNHPSDLKPWTVAEVLDPGAKVAISGGEVRPMWVSIEVPRDCKSGEYTVEFLVSDGAKATKKAKKQNTLRLKVVVVDRQLPEPKDYTIHIDIWQQPYSVSRYYGVKPWSDAHFDLLRPYMQRLARMGQKVVSAILFYEPWGQQSNDKFLPMVETTLKSDGTWTYDYAVFDKWVEFMASCGIDKQIDCYSMVPWDMSFRYFDEAKGEYQALKTSTTTEEYKALWTSFLTAFATHLKEKGWFDKTCIAMDERGLDDMLNAYAIAQEAVPGIKMTLAGNIHEELCDKLYDYSIAYGQAFNKEELAERRSKGWHSTVYTCCSDFHPGMFTNSNPVDAAWLGIYCKAADFDGWLHWSWLNWTDNPMEDSRFFLFQPGDTYFFYPGNRTSLRHERLLEGIQQFEKINIFRQLPDVSTETRAELEEILQEMVNKGANDTEQVTKQVNRVEDILNGVER